MALASPDTRLPELQKAFAEAFENDPLRAAFARRAVKALVDLTTTLSKQDLTAAVSAETDTRALVLGLLARPTASGVSSEPIQAARLRGVTARDELLAEEGGVASAEEVKRRRLLPLSRQAIDRRRARGDLLAVDVGKRGYLYPVWQFAAETGTLPGLERVLEVLRSKDVSPISQVRFFLSGSHRLNGDRPLDRLRRGDVDAVLRDANAFLDQGAA